MEGAQRTAAVEKSALWAWPLAGAAIGAVVAAVTVRINPTVGGGSDGLVFSAWTTLVYAAAFLPLGLLAGFARARCGAAPLAAAHLVAALAAFGAFAAAQAAVTNDKWRPEHHPTSLAAGLGAAVLATLAAVVLSARPGVARRLAALARWPLAALVVAAVAWGSAVLAPSQDAGAASAPKPVLPQIQPGVRRVLLLGVDGLDPSKVEELIGRGRLPNLRALRERGVWSPMATDRPTWSPVLWTTAATGVGGAQHGVLDFTEIAVPGIEHGLQRLRRGALTPGCTAFAPLVELLVRTHALRETSISGWTRRVPAVWNILSDLGQEVALLGWYATWPAETVHGSILVDIEPRESLARFARDPSLRPLGFVHPPELADELVRALPAEVLRLDSEVSTEEMLALPIFRELTAEERSTLASTHESHRELAQQEGVKPDLLRVAYNVFWRDEFLTQTAVHLLHTRKPDFLALYVLGTDNVCHCLYDRRGVVERLYDAADDQIGRCVAAAGPDTDVIVMSDHGWSFEGRNIGHQHGPDGVLLLAGPSFTPGAKLERKPTLYDIAPTILALRGLPRTSAMPGAALLSAFSAERRAAAPTQEIASYGPYVRTRSAAGRGDATREKDVERLKTLGYVE